MKRVDMSSKLFSKLTKLGENDNSDIKNIIDCKKNLTDDLVFKMQSLGGNKVAKAKVEAKRRNSVVFSANKLFKTKLNLKNLLNGEEVDVDTFDRKSDLKKNSIHGKEINGVNVDMLYKVMERQKVFLTGVIDSQRSRSRVNNTALDSVAKSTKFKNPSFTPRKFTLNEQRDSHSPKKITRNKSESDLGIKHRRASSMTNLEIAQSQVSSRFPVKKISDKALLSKFNGKFIRKKYENACQIISVNGKKFISEKYKHIKGKLLDSANPSLVPSPSTSFIGSKSSTSPFKKGKSNSVINSARHSITNDDNFNTLIQKRYEKAIDLKKAVKFTNSRSSRTYHTLKNIQDIQKTEREIREKKFEKESLKELFFHKSGMNDLRGVSESVEGKKDNFDKLMNTLNNDVIFNNRNILVDKFGFNFDKDKDLVFKMAKRRQDYKFKNTKENQYKLIRLQNSVNIKSAELYEKINGILKVKKNK